MKKKYFFNFIYLTLLFFLFFCNVFGTDTTTTARIIGNDINSLLDQIDTTQIDLKHATYLGSSPDLGTDSYNEKKNIIKEKFDNNAYIANEWDYTRDFYFHTDDFETQELFIAEGNDGSDYDEIASFKGSFDIDKKDLKKVDKYFPLMVLDSYKAGQIDKPENFANQLSHSTIIAPSERDSREFTRSFLCSLGNHKNLGTTLKNARNNYNIGFSNSQRTFFAGIIPILENEDEITPLTLSSYNLYGNPLAEVSIPNTLLYIKDCDDFEESLAEINYLGQFNPKTQQSTLTDNIIFNYNIIKKDNYNYINISNSYLPKEGNQIPILKFTKEYALDVIFQNISASFYNPQKETLNLSYKNTTNYKTILQNYICQNITPTYSYEIIREQDRQILKFTVMPVKEINCKPNPNNSNEFKIYKEFAINVQKDFIYPLFIKQIQYPTKIPTNNQFNITILSERYQNAEDEIILINNNQIIAKKSENISNKITFKLNATNDLDNKFTLQYITYSNKNKTQIKNTLNKTINIEFTKFKIDYNQQTIKTRNKTINLTITNYLNTSHQAGFEAILYNKSQIMQKFKENITLPPKTNSKQLLYLQNLSRYDERYSLHINLNVKGMKPTTQIIPIYTNTKPEFIGKTQHTIIFDNNTNNTNNTKIKYFKLEKYDYDNDTLTENISPFTRFNATHIMLNLTENKTKNKSGKQFHIFKISDNYSITTKKIELTYNTKPKLFDFKLNNLNKLNKTNKTIITSNAKTQFNLTYFNYTDKDFDIINPKFELIKTNKNKTTYQELIINNIQSKSIPLQNTTIQNNQTIYLNTSDNNEIISFFLVLSKTNQSETINNLIISSKNRILSNLTSELLSFDTIELTAKELRKIKNTLYTKSIPITFKWQGNTTLKIETSTLTKRKGFEIQLPQNNKTNSINTRISIQDDYSQSNYIYKNFTIIDNKAYNIDKIKINPINSNLFELILQNTGKYAICNATINFSNNIQSNIQINPFEQITILINGNFSQNNTYNGQFLSGFLNQNFSYKYAFSNISINHTILQSNNKNIIVEYMFQNHENKTVNLNFNKNKITLQPFETLNFIDYFNPNYNTNKTIQTITINEKGIPKNYTYKLPSQNQIISNNNKTQENSSILESFKYLGNNVYEIIFNNNLSNHQVIEFYLGNNSYYSVLSENERKVFIIKHNLENITQNCDLMYLNYDYYK